MRPWLPEIRRVYPNSYAPVESAPAELAPFLTRLGQPGTPTTGTPPDTPNPRAPTRPGPAPQRQYLDAAGCRYEIRMPAQALHHSARRHSVTTRSPGMVSTPSADRPRPRYHPLTPRLLRRDQ